MENAARPYILNMFHVFHLHLRWRSVACRHASDAVTLLLEMGKNWCKNWCKNIWERMISRIRGLDRTQDKDGRITREADRLDEKYGPPCPRQSSPLPTEWYLDAPNWVFQARHGTQRSREDQIEEIVKVHAERMERYEKEIRGYQRQTGLST